MDATTPFRYAAACSSPGCPGPPRFKIAAPWSHGPIRELKGYGLACERHLEALLARAEEHRRALAIRDDEEVGPVEVFPLPSNDPTHALELPPQTHPPTDAGMDPDPCSSSERLSPLDSR